MERLEAAMAKARAARALAESQRAALDAGTAPPAEQAQTERVQTAPQDWAALPAIEISTRQARRQRLTAILGAEVSTPFDILRSRVVRQMQENGWSRLAVTSPTTQCGKSTIALNLALSLARYGQLRIVLMDMDLRRPSLAQMLDQQTTAPDIATLLQPEGRFADHAVRHGANLAICLNRAPVHHSAELLQGAATSAALDRIEAEWQPDIMVFDTPPMQGSDDNLGFFGKIDCALIVAAAGQSTLAQIDRCEQEVGNLTNVLGTVLNKCRYPDKTTSFDQAYYYT